MPAKDLYHDTVKTALIKDGWTITHDPLILRFGKKDMYVDLGAERLLAAERGQEKIAVEVKSFVGPSEMTDLERAVGQYIVYHDVLAQEQPDRTLYLAVPDEIEVELFEEEPLGKLLLQNNRLKLITFDVEQEVIVKWTP